jgi:uncharacterized protein
MREQLDEFIPKHSLLLVSVNQGIKDRNLFDAARYAWPLNPARAERIELVLACNRGIVEGVFVPIEWLDASPGEQTKANFSDLLVANPGFIPTHSDKRQRLGFRGTEADEETKRHYVGRRVPDTLKIGQNGFRYSIQYE